MKSIPDDILYNINIGVSVYFFGKPSEKRIAICNAVERYFQLVSHKMTVFGFLDGKIRSTRGKVFPDFLLNKIMEYDFNNTFTFQLYNLTKNEVQSAGMELIMTDFDGKPFFGTHNPNQLYFEFPSDTVFSDIISFIRDLYVLLDYRCAFCNPVISENQYYYPMSYRRSIQQLKTYPICFPKEGYFFNFRNEVQYDLLLGANLIQLYSSDYSQLFEKMNIEDLNNIANYLFSDFYLFDIIKGFESNSFSQFSYEDNMLIFGRLKQLYRFIKPFMTSFEKRRDRYFKPDEWNEWIKRFD